MIAKIQISIEQLGDKAEKIYIVEQKAKRKKNMTNKLKKSKEFSGQLPEVQKEEQRKWRDRIIINL